MTVTLANDHKECYDKVFFAYFNLFYNSKLLQKLEGKYQDMPYGLVPEKEAILTKNYFSQFDFDNFSLN